MARFKIISKDGSTIRCEGKPEYKGTYLKPSYLEFSDIASPTPIAWEIGDYVDYVRTGMRYYLYSIPQPSKNARRGTNGGAFIYSNVQFYSATKDLEIALFRDLVDNDNNIHFSTTPDVATFENVAGIARRIQACLDDIFPGKWEIRLADFDAEGDADILENIETAKEFALSSGTCLDALSKIYELWDDFGWIHSYDKESGKEVITIGYANKRIEGNTTDAYLYGKGNGLTAIKKNQTNKDEFATRLYVYGSERNLPSRYYNSKSILNAESVDIRNLMIPLDKWGKTDGLPDARKAYLENEDAVAKYGIIPRTHYFDSEDAGADVYPSISKMTIGQIREAMVSPSSEYYPSDVYSDSERVDVIRSVVNPIDNGIIVNGDKEFKYGIVEKTSAVSIDANIVDFADGEQPILLDHPLFSKTIEASFEKAEVKISPNIECIIPDADFSIVQAIVKYSDNEDISMSGVSVKKIVTALKDENGDSWRFKIPSVKLKYETPHEDGRFPIYITLSLSGVRKKNIDAETITISIRAGEVFIGANELLDKTFHITLKQIGFDINTQASLGEGKTISMKTGACSGRNFIIDSCFYVSSGDFWSLDLRRQKDNTLGMMFPNKDYPISVNDYFVLLDIAMPNIYIGVASLRLLSEGEKLLAKASKIQSNYEPSVDAKVMIESGRSLREGMFMEISDEDVVENGKDFILIDTLSIYEDESAIPTYQVTLRERRKVTYKGTPSATSTTDTESAEDEDVQTNVDLSDYYSKDEVDSRVNANSDRIKKLEGFWYDKDDVLTTDKLAHIKNNLIIDGDTASGGEGSSDVNVGINEEQLKEYLDANKYVTETWIAEQRYVTLATYATGIGQLGNRITTIENSYVTGNTLASYALKSEIPTTLPASDVYAWAKKSSLALADVPDLSSKYLPLSGGTITGSSSSPLKINTSSTTIGIPLNVSNVNKSWIGWSAGQGAYLWNASANKYLGIKEDGTPYYDSYTLIHSGNIENQTVSAAKKLVTSGGADAVTVDTSKNVTIGGELRMANQKAIYFNDTAGARQAALYMSNGNNLWLGYESAANGYNTYIAGKEVSFRYNGNSSVGIYLNSSGNVGIGTSSPTYKLEVNGVARATGWSGNNVNISCDANGDTSGYSGEINRFGGGQLYIQARSGLGTLNLGNASGGVKMYGAVTMSSNCNINGNLVVAGDVAVA